MKRQWTTVLVIVLALIVVIFSVLNVDPVAINFGFREFEMPLAVVLIGTLLIGFLMAVMLSTTIIIRNKNEKKKLTKRLNEMEDIARKEQQDLVAKHQNETRTLQEKIETEQARNRELNRKIQNMRTSQSVQKGHL